jgi:hypothetical protein
MIPAHLMLAGNVPRPAFYPLSMQGLIGADALHDA